VHNRSTPAVYFLLSEVVPRKGRESAGISGWNPW
jgi:hypothetical protein